MTPQPKEPEYLISMDEIDSLCCTSIDTGVYTPGTPEYERAIENLMQTKAKILSREIVPSNTQTDIVIKLLQMHCRNVINTDKSGLAFGLARCKQIAEGYNWIPRREWGDYDCDHRTVATLQKEVGYMIEELVETCERALRESGERANVNVREVEMAIATLGEEKP